MTNQVGSRADHFLGLAESCLEMTGRLLQKYKYRIAGTPECRQAAHEIADRFRESCDIVHEEAFRLHPKALWYVGKAIAVIYLLAAACVVIGGYFLYLGAFICLLGASYALVQYVFFGRLFDRIFKSAGGRNVVGSLEPSDIAKQQIVLVGHHDSPFIFRFLERLQSIAFIRFLLGILSFTWICVFCLVASIQQLLSGGSYAPPGLPIWITVAGLPFALQLFFMMSSDPSPGAGDNLNSISMLASMAQHFHSERGQGCPLKHTRLIFLSTDGEEIGQRGAIRYVQSHHSQLRAMPTFVLNIDSIYHSKDLKILTRDRNSTCKLSNSMISDIFMVASELGLHLKRGPIPLGGGGTDAAAFATAGIKATSIIGMPTSFISKDHLYHTSNDTVDHIEADAVKAVLQLAVGYIRYVDDH